MSSRYSTISLKTCLESTVSESTFALNRSRTSPRVSPVSRWISAGARTKRVFFLMRFHCEMSDSSSRLSMSGVTSSLTVRTMTPPDFSGRNPRTISFNRWRSAPAPIFRLTPTLVPPSGM